MEVLAALLPPVVVAAAFIVIIRAAIRHADGRNGGESDNSTDDT
jgi:hypothetical protein